MARQACLTNEGMKRNGAHGMEKLPAASRGQRQQQEKASDDHKRNAKMQQRCQLKTAKVKPVLQTGDTGHETRQQTGQTGQAPHQQQQTFHFPYPYSGKS
jgi:FtsZ-interacting cell division protein ZipA